jgi:hypothetical protein
MTVEHALDNPILAEHAAAIRRLGKRVVDDVIEIGARLKECRGILKEDDRWRAWLESELKLSHQSAGRFIQVHELFEQRSNLDHIDLPVSALYLVAAPSTPETAKSEIIERAKAGERLPVAEVKRVVDTAKGRKPSRKPSRPTTKPQIAPATDVQAIRDAPAKRIRTLRTGQPEPRTHEDIGADSRAEAERLRVRIEELQADKRRLEIKIAGLESEVEELRAKPTGTGGAMSYSEFQTAIKKWEETIETQRGIIARLEHELANLRAGVAAPPDDDLDIPAAQRRAAR